MKEHLFPYGLPSPLAGAPFVEVLDSAGLTVTSFTPESGVRGSRVLTDAAIGDGDTITIFREDGSSQVYTWKTTLTPTAGEVLIGASNTTALTNMGFAITGDGTTTEVAAGTEPCLEYDVASDGTTLTLTALNYGDYLNTALGLFEETGDSASWAAVTSGVDTPDFRENLDYAGAATASAAPFQRDGIFPLCPSAAQLTCQVDHIEFDDNSGGGVIIRRDFLFATTDHPKAKYTRGCIYAGQISTPASDIVTGGLLIDIPINSSHADSGDWTGDDTTMPPETDDVVNGDWIELFNPYSGFSELGAIRDFDADGGAAANEARITLVAPGLQNVTTLQGGSAIYYRIYRSAVTAVDILTINQQVISGDGGSGTEFQGA